jgi:subtilisin family serine protease
LIEHVRKSLFASTRPLTTEPLRAIKEKNLMVFHPHAVCTTCTHAALDRQPTVWPRVHDACVPFKEAQWLDGKGSAKLPMVQLDLSWLTTAGRSVCLGLIDGAIEHEHPDLVSADIIFRDFTGPRKCVNTTHCTRSALMLIGQGLRRLRGIAPSARLLVASVVDSSGEAKPSTVARALIWMIHHEVKVLAVPLGSANDYPAVHGVIARAANAGMVIFAASGEGGVCFPASYNEVISVAAGQCDGRPLCGGRYAVDLVAPGFEIEAPVSDAVAMRTTGSSIACVLASGLAALAISSEPSLRSRAQPSQVLYFLTRRTMNHG